MNILIILLFLIFILLFFINLNNKNIENYFGLYNAIVVLLFYIMPYPITLICGLLSISIIGYILLRRII